jgi:hypothetical protein
VTAIGVTLKPRWARAVLVAALWIASLPATVHAQCVEFRKPEELFAHSEVVFRGTVVATEATGETGDHQIVEIATLRVAQVWKGDPGRRVRVGADRGFKIDKEYLVFAGGQPLTTTILCRWTEPIEQAKAKLDWLAKRKEPAEKPKRTSGRTPILAMILVNDLPDGCVNTR